MSSSEDITVELMQEMLREFEKDSTIVVQPGLEVKELNEDLHGGSCLSRVTVTYTRGGDTSQHSLSLIVKVVPKNSLGSNFQKSSAFPREIHMFNEILPRMSALLAQSLPDRHTDFSARVYYTRKTPTYLIAIEDLAPKGFKAPRRKNGLDLKHCLLTLRTLARFHAASVVIKREDEGLFAMFGTYSYEELKVNEMMKGITDNCISVTAQKMESRQDLGPKWADRVRKQYQTVNDDLHQAWKRDDNGFNVLNHGDFGLHNVMFRYSESTGEVEAIMLVDFQTCSYNSPALDLQQLIFGSASNEVRENHIETLLREYHIELTTTLESLGVPREQTISLPQLVDEFDRKIAFGFYYLTCFLPFMTTNFDSLGLTDEEIFKPRDDVMDKIQLLITDSRLTHLSRMLLLFSHKNLLWPSQICDKV